VKDFRDKVAVITGAASGIGRELAYSAARRGMKLILADVQLEALEHARNEVAALGVPVLAVRCDVRKAEQVQRLADAAMAGFGVIHLLFNNAGVAAGGLVWENTQADWEWVLGVNLWGAVHGVRIFTPVMLACADADPAYQGHIVNTASYAGLLNAPLMGIYNVSKHAVMSLTETLYHDLKLIDARVGASVLCPYFVPTGICESERHRPEDVMEARTQTASQAASHALSEKAVSSGKVSAAEIAERSFAAIANGKFYIHSHPQALDSVRVRMEDVLLPRTPTDPYQNAPHIGAMLLSELKKGG
jgi:NAD(P)-dependent dehydrogenase (short-subunit alcohol dehydrogenase family)